MHSLTPESSLQVQQKLGADLVVVLDECTPFHGNYNSQQAVGRSACFLSIVITSDTPTTHLYSSACHLFAVDKAYTAASMRRSHRWALRSLREFRRLGCSGTSASGATGTVPDSDTAATAAAPCSTPLQALYGIIQGGVFEDLRRESAAFINSYPFFGTAIGGSLGADRATMHAVLSFTRPLVRDDRPVHLLGIGKLLSLIRSLTHSCSSLCLCLICHNTPPPLPYNVLQGGSEIFSTA